MLNTTKTTYEVVWQPQPGPQSWLITCPVFETLFGGARGGGKGQLYSSSVLTPFGWKTFEDLKIGDSICDTKGGVQRVIGYYPQGLKRVFKLNWSDGSSTICDESHIWLGWFSNKSRKIKGERTSGRNSEQKYTTQNIYDLYQRDLSTNQKFGISVVDEPVCFTVQGESVGQDLFLKRWIPPYVLGVLLGDGSISDENIRFTTADFEIKNKIEDLLYVNFDHYKSITNLATMYRIPNWVTCISDEYDEINIKNNLELLNLYGKTSENKFIPRIYLMAPVEERLELLRGLMDTDGWSERDGDCYYCTISEQLSKDVTYLARSLGAVVSLKEKIPNYWYKGEKKEGQLAYVLRIKIVNAENIFSLERKKENCRYKKYQSMAVWLDAIEYFGQKETVCIQVSNPNNLYITDDFIVTHNSDGVLGEWAAHADQYGANAIGLCVRRERTQLRELIERSRVIYRPLGATFHEIDKMWRFPNGARLTFAYLENDTDAQAYQGHSYTRVYIEEMGTFANPDPIFKLMATLRSGVGVPCRFIGTANPGGPGHLWIKQRYVDPAPFGLKILTDIFVNPFTKEEIPKERVFIPSKVTDNKYTNTPEYIGNLQLAGNEELVKAWLLGDWNVLFGAFFQEWNTTKHVIKQFPIPRNWTRFMSMDWGSMRPFSVGWWAVVPDDFDFGWETKINNWVTGQRIKLPRGAIVRYKEWYGAAPLPAPYNTGLKMTVEDVARGIRDREYSEPRGDNGRPRIAYRVVDPKMFHEDGGPSMAERMANAPYYVSLVRADNKRTTRSGAMGGWDQVRARLKGEDGLPMLYFMDNCVDAIRTLPALQHDEKNLEDVDTKGEDHAPDEIRYACMSRPYSRPAHNEVIRGLLHKRDNSFVIHDDLEVICEPNKFNSARIH